MANARVARGRLTQRILADYYRANGWPDAEPTWGTQPGRDLRQMLGLAPEVKATTDVPLLAALRQATRNASGDLPYVVWRPNGRGPDRIGEWVVAMTLHDHTTLLRAAGYGATP